MSSPKGSIVITGANGGLGSAMVSQIVSTNLGREHHGVYLVRNPNAPTHLRDTLRRASDHKHDLISLDLASLSNVREAAAAINKRVAEGSLPRIRALILNAGYQDSTKLNMSGDGFEMSFQVNYLSHFLLTLLILQSIDQQCGRILIVGSWSHDTADPRNEMGIAAGAYKGKWKTLLSDIDGLARGKWSTPDEDPTFHAGYRRYGASKLCEVIFMHDLQTRLLGDSVLSNISVLALDPGAMGTDLMRNNSWLNRKMMSVAMPVVASITTRMNPNGTMRTTSKSAEDAMRACFDTETLGERPRELYLNGSEEKETGVEARDEGKRAELWSRSVKYVQLKEGDTVLTQWK